MALQTYNVTGMSCEHCERAVTEEVTKLPGVSSLHVSAADGLLSFDADPQIADADVIAAVDEAGYDAARA